MGAANDSVITGLCSGVYTLTFTDENGCPSTLLFGGVNQQTISPNNITEAQINMSSISTILCNGSATGELEALSPNTSVGYTYSWQDSNGNVVSNTTTASNLLAGTYVLYADYNNITGCTVTDTATVTELSIINPSVVVTHVDCDGNATGILQGSVQGGTSPYNMLWNPGGMTGASVDSLLAGTYTLIVTDSNNCQETDTFEVTQPQELFVSIDSVGYVLTASTPTGGTAPYSYSWREQSNALNEIGTGLSYVVSNYGTYYVVVTDVNGCTVESNSFSFNASWDCIGSVCVDPGDGNGLYSSLSSCEALCLATEINVILGEVILNIYPNPFKDETTVDFGRKVNKATVTIVDVYGKMIEKHELTNIDKHIITKNTKASGVYFMKIEINKQYLNNIKLVIE
jgi:hypothetical protein